MSGARDQILLCARDIFLEEGMSHFSMRKVASCAGITATAIYRHFADKEELLFSVLLKGFRIFADYQNRIEQQLEPFELLQETVTAYIDFALHEQAYYEMMFMVSDRMTGLKRLNADGYSEMQATFTLLQQRVARAMETGAIESEDARLTAYGIWAYAHGQISLFVAGRVDMEQEQFTEVYNQLMQEYLHHL